MLLTDDLFPAHAYGVTFFFSVLWEKSDLVRPARRAPVKVAACYTGKTDLQYLASGAVSHCAEPLSSR